MPRLAMVHVQDPRVRWSVPASEVVRIIAAAEWSATSAIDILAGLGPLPGTGTHDRRVVVVRGVDDRETALLAAGPIGVIDVDPTDILPLPDALAATAQAISAIVVEHDATLSLLFIPSAVIPPDDRAS